MSKEIKGDIYQREAIFKTELENVLKKILSSNMTIFYDGLVRESELKFKIPHSKIVKEIERYVKEDQIEIYQEGNKNIISVIPPWKMDQEELF